MQNNYRWCEQMAYEKIVEARAGAARDRLALTAVQARRDSLSDKGTLFARLLRVLASAFGRGHPTLETTVPAGHAR